MSLDDFTPSQAARLTGCSRSSIYRYEQAGKIRASRDHNGWRRFPAVEVERLKELLTRRVPPSSDAGGGDDHGGPVFRRSSSLMARG